MRPTLLLLLAFMSLVGASTRAADYPAQADVPTIDEVRVLAERDDPDMARPDFDDSGWRTQPWRHVDPQGRLLWVRAHVPLSAAQVTRLTDRPLLARVSAMAAYEVYWNGERVGASGIPGVSARAETPGPIDTAHVLPSRLTRVGDNVLALRMSSFHLPRRLSEPMHLLVITPFAGGGAGRDLPWFAVACAGALLIGAAYFAILYLSDRRDRGALWLSLLALCVLVQLCAELTRVVWHYPYPLQITRLWLVLAAAACTGLLLTLYVAERHARATRWRWLGGGAAAMATVITVFEGFDVKTYLVIGVALLAVIGAAFRELRARDGDATVTVAWATGVIAWQFAQPDVFIDQTWYLVITALLLILFAQQVGVLRREQEQRATAQLRATRLELELVKRQIQPHFLLNSLTALSEWIESDPAVGVRMIEALADEFRDLSAIGDRTVIPLAEELRLCRHHLTIMSLRLDRPFELQCTDLDERHCVPPAVFHTLIENALTHNAYPTGATLRLSAQRQADGRWRYTLRTPCTAPAASPTRVGQGLNYVRARLHEAFGDRASHVATRVDDTWIDTVTVPEHRACAW